MQFFPENRKNCPKPPFLGLWGKHHWQIVFITNWVSVWCSRVVCACCAAAAAAAACPDMLWLRCASQAIFGIVLTGGAGFGIWAAIAGIIDSAVQWGMCCPGTCQADLLG